MKSEEVGQPQNKIVQGKSCCRIACGGYPRRSFSTFSGTLESALVSSVSQPYSRCIVTPKNASWATLQIQSTKTKKLEVYSTRSTLTLGSKLSMASKQERGGTLTTGRWGRLRFLEDSSRSKCCSTFSSRWRSSSTNKNSSKRATNEICCTTSSERVSRR